ncbi:MAG: acetyl-CoA carboxylase, biotin carboxylase [Bacillota bacterium]|jgi:acetyl-CoA carboxylase biotin carboxylase subunit
MAEKLLVANRGEIAVRVIRACKELSIPTVAVYSTADRDTMAVKLADESICIGEARSKNSYLNINNVISAAVATGATLIHPGYGFLSENEQFAEIVASCGLKFVGPSANAIRQIGDKASAKVIARKAGVPVIEGSEGIVENLEEGLTVAKKVGFPVMIKATSGGGGRGISIIRSEKEFRDVFDRTSMEAEASFGDKNLYVEKYIENPRHIEIQILCDSHGSCVYLGERDCSLQRRNQKMVEEGPSPVVDARLRKKMGEAAVKLAKAVGYVNAGTIEFLVDKNLNYYFIEMNTRIQVEHPVTEFITGIDLVKEQIKIALGKKLPFTQRQIKITGHAIECRINAEDVKANFRPAPGKITQLIMPGGIGVRIDTHIYPGYEVPPFYDSMIAKLIVHAPTRKEAIRKMLVALEQFMVDGITTNIEFHYSILHTQEFISGNVDTGFVARFLERIKDMHE